MCSYTADHDSIRHQTTDLRPISVRPLQVMFKGDTPNQINLQHEGELNDEVSTDADLSTKIKKNRLTLTLARQQTSSQ